jgi:hypothetical protein
MANLVECTTTPTAINLTKLFDDCPSTDPLAWYQAEIREWATQYLSAPHPDLGRDGPVCPFTAPSINKGMFWVGCVDRPDITADEIESTVSGMVARFHRLPPTEGPDVLLKATLILFPTVTSYEIIDQAQRRLKDKFVAKGLMIGQFYPGCAEPGLWDPQFRPLQSPIALLAIRHMVSNDFPFLAAKTEWIESYLKRFAPSIPSAIRNTLATRLGAQKPNTRPR